MGKKNNIIEINGKRYDARSGAALDHHAAKHTKSVDGVVRSTPHPARHTGHKSAATPVKRSIQVSDISSTKNTSVHASKTRQHPTAQTVSRHTPQAARTLMRRAVKKPAPGLKRQARAQSSTDKLLAKPQHTLSMKKSVHRLDNTRLQRARRVSKSHLISRFADVGQPSVPIMAPEPITIQFTPAVPHIAADRKPIALKRPKTTADFLEHALQHATSHQQPPHPLKKKRRFSFV